jgi:hypothetical protein
MFIPYLLCIGKCACHHVEYHYLLHLEMTFSSLSELSFLITWVSAQMLPFKTGFCLIPYQKDLILSLLPSPIIFFPP